MLLAQAILHDGLVALEDGLLHDPRRTPRRFQALSEIWAHLRFVKNFAGLLFFFMEERAACCGR